MRVYISGPITGVPDFLEKFQAAETLLISKGYDVVNPCKLEHGHDGSWENFMRVDIVALMSCDAIYMLAGWPESRGACIEHRLALDLGMSVLSSSSWQ